MPDPVVLRKSIHVRQDGILRDYGWVVVSNIRNVAMRHHGNYLYKVDDVEYHSRSAEWREKLSELQTWSRLCTTTKS